VATINISTFYILPRRKVAGSIPDEVIGFFNLPNPSSRTMALGSTQPLIEMSTRNPPGGKGRPARKTDKVTAICVSRLSRKRGIPVTGIALLLPLHITHEMYL
jgi:hypothetical protein